MGHAGKCMAGYVELPGGEFPPTCIIHGKGHSSEDCKVLDSLW